MDRIAREFFSMRMMALGLFVFLLAIGLATFLESIYDTQTSKLLVYNAKWFELLLIYLGIGTIANIFTYRMYQREKIAILMFHLSFIVILIGAAVTRFSGFEGLMIIKEGQSVNYIYSSEPYFWMRVTDESGGSQVFQKKAYMSEVTNNYFSQEMQVKGRQNPVTIEYVKFEKNMVHAIVEHDTIREEMLGFAVSSLEPEFIGPGEILNLGSVALSYENDEFPAALRVRKEGGKYLLTTNVPVSALPMKALQQARQTGEVPDSLKIEIPADTTIVLEKEKLYQTAGGQFVFKEIKKHAKKVLQRGKKKDEGLDYLTVRITDGDTKEVIKIPGGQNSLPRRIGRLINGVSYEMTYGPISIELPFSIMCRDFQLDRYPGSDSPSSFASEVTIIDSVNNNPNDQRRIFMNNVLDYQGYRFFQSGYEPDESGTHLSVNHDWWGTNISYLGYLMMAIGMIMSLFSPAGRVRELTQLIRKNSEKMQKMSSVILVLFLAGSVAFAEDTTMVDTHEGHDHAHNHESAQPEIDTSKFAVMSVEHSDELASLVVQNFRGRMMPLHTLCDMLLRKVHRSQEYKGYNAVQTIMSMHLYPQYWIHQEMIYVSSKGGWREKLGVEKYVSFDALMNWENGQFKYQEEYEKAHRMPESKRGEPEKRLIKLVERFEIMRGIFTPTWDYIRILPDETEKSTTWTPIMAQGVQSRGFILAVDYIGALVEASENNGSYKDASAKLDKLKKHQRKLSNDIMPSKSMVDMEVNYNKLNIFRTVQYILLTSGMLLFIVFFVKIFARPTAKGRKVFNYVFYTIVGVVMITFAYLAYGLYMRSMIAGHVPWSDAYEAIIFISLIALFFGLLFFKRNVAILAGTALLAFFMIFVSEMNLLDPEVTPLQPVLKSYWLMIHVAIITGSYAPLGIASILSLINMILYLFRTEKNGKYISSNITELTYVAEILMIIGVFMLTIGTFLGGIWANESWGRYWGWDPKETWALVAILAYAVVLHLRYIPSMKDKFTFNVVTFWSYASIIFTFFGVNFYLVGLHSYANGEGLGEIPGWIIWFVVIMYVIWEFAAIRNQLYKSKGAMVPLSYFKKKLLLLFVPILFTALLTWILGVSDIATVGTNLGKAVLLILAVNLALHGFAYLRSKNNSNTLSEL